MHVSAFLFLKSRAEIYLEIDEVFAMKKKKIMTVSWQHQDHITVTDIMGVVLKPPDFDHYSDDGTYLN